MNTPKAINIGSIKIGNGFPVLLQSMTSTPTMDTTATVEQAIRIAEAGAHLIRITAQNTNEAHHLAVIKQELKQRGYEIPIIADIHFTPKAAEVAATIVEKVRINPGNYILKKSGQLNWSDKEYQEDLDHIKTKLTSLVKNCKIHQTAIRVGVNHGSLSERIVSKYGDTAQGMTESAMEFIRIFKDLGFTNLVISLKASNVLVMVDSNRLLIKKMKAENSFYPLHLGVTEAGNAEEGRIKSALGIGSLLSEGIGNTIRVSLTEEAEYEIPVAKKIVEAALENQWENDDFDLPIQYQRKESYGIYNIGNQQLPIVVNHQHNDHSSTLNADYIFDPASNSLTSTDQKNNLRNCNIEDLINSKLNSDQQYFLNIAPNQWTDQLIKSLVQSKNILLVIEKKDSITLTEIIQLLEKIEKNNISCPIIFRINCLKSNIENLMIHASIIAAPLLLAAKLDGIWIDSPTFSSTEISFGILQASRQRISKTEYIACPSCGRTLFNIQKKLEEIKKETTDLVGLKIAIMGCIVNGPGEMADADYGYVGAGPNQVNIYKGHQIIKKNVAEDEATKVLLEIIRSEV